MTATAHAAIRNTHTAHGWSWCATIGIGGETIAIDFGYALTMEAAQAAARNAIDRMDRELSDEVHASRATRRATPNTTDVHTLEPTA